MNNNTTCQACGRSIQAKTGTIAHHGYQRPAEGWQTASCIGAKRLPYESSCDVIEAAIEQAESFLAFQKEKIAQAAVNPPAQIKEFPTEYIKRMMKWSGYELRTISRPAHYDINKSGYDWKHNFKDHKEQEAYNDYHYTLEAYIREWRSNVAWAERQIVFLKERAADWKETLIYNKDSKTWSRKEAK